MDGVIETSANLELMGFTSAGLSAQLSADQHVVTIFGDPVTYVYRVNEEEGGRVYVRLTAAESADGAGGLFSMEDELWEGTVQPAGSQSSLPLQSKLEAAGVMTGPSAGVVPSGGKLEIVFVSPEGGGMDGEIRISENLTFEGMRSVDLGAELSAPDHVVSLFADPVTYTYRVDAQPGEEVSVELVNAKSADAERNLYTVPEQTWTGTVGDPNMVVEPEPTPEPPTRRPAQDPVGAFMIAPSAAVEGRCIEVQFTSPLDGGMEGYIEVSDNLVFESLQGGFLSSELSNERKAVSLFGEPLTYVYRVEAEAGEDISVSLARGQQSDGSCALSPVEPEEWTCTVEAAPDGDDASRPFVAMMDVPDPSEVVAGATIDVSFLSPPDGGMNGSVSTSSNLRFIGTVSSGNGARLSTDDQVKSLLGVPVTYRYRVTGDAGEPVYVRLTDGRTAEAGKNQMAKVRNQIWMGVVEDSGESVITPVAGSGLQVGPSGRSGIGGVFVTGADHTMTVGDLLSGLSAPEGLTLDVCTENGNSLDAAAGIATGQYVRATLNGEVQDRAAVVVPGDVTGRGAPGVGQLVRLATACAKGAPLQGAFLLAGDLNGNGSADVGDLACMAHLIQSAG